MDIAGAAPLHFNADFRSPDAPNILLLRRGVFGGFVEGGVKTTGSGPALTEVWGFDSVGGGRAQGPWWLRGFGGFVFRGFRLYTETKAVTVQL